MTNNEDSLTSTRDHLERLLRKRNALNHAIDECCAAFVVQAARLEPGPSDMVALRQFARDCQVPGFVGALLKELGVSASRVNRWQLAPPDRITTLEGTLPVLYQRLPNKGSFCVYLLKNDANEVLYVGCSSSVSSRLGTHHRAKIIPATRFEIVTCPTKRESVALEGDLIFQHQPPYNRADRKNRRFVA